MIDAQFANNAHEEILELVKLSRPHCESLPDKAKCYIIETKALAALGQIDLAITAGLNGLDTLSIPIPVTDAAAVVFAVRGSTRSEGPLTHDHRKNCPKHCIMMLSLLRSWRRCRRSQSRSTNKY